MTDKRLARVMATANVLLFAVGSAVTPITGFAMGATWEHTNPHVYPHLFTALGLVALHVWASATTERSHIAPRVAGWAQPITAITVIWAISRWPPGDDGPGMFWMFFVWPTTAVVLMIAAAGVAAVVRARGRADVVAKRSERPALMSAALSGAVAVYLVLAWFPSVNVAWWLYQQTWRPA